MPAAWPRVACKLFGGGRLALEAVPRRVARRWRHSDALDQQAGLRVRQLARGQRGALGRVRGPDEGRELRKALAEAKECSKVWDLLEQAPGASYADFAKGMQVCGQRRDVDTLLRLWHMARERDVKLSRPAYSILITAAARCARGRDGQGENEEDRQSALDTGKAAWAWMRHEHGSPGRVEYGSALGLCAKAGELAWAKELWTEMLQSSDVQPDTVHYNQYLETMVVHGGPSGWQTAEGVLDLMRERGVRPSAVTLSALTNAAALQYSLERVGWLWDRLASKVELNALVYCSKSKALLLCGEISRVPPLRGEMGALQIAPCFRNLLHEVQALVLMMLGSPPAEAAGLHAKLEEGFSAAMEILRRQGEPDADAGMRTSQHEVMQLRQMKQAADQLLQGEPLALADVRVMKWPWQAAAG